MINTPVQSKGWTWAGGEAPWKASKDIMGAQLKLILVYNEDQHIYNVDLATTLEALNNDYADKDRNSHPYNEFS